MLRPSVVLLHSPLRCLTMTLLTPAALVLLLFCDTFEGHKPWFFDVLRMLFCFPQTAFFMAGNWGLPYVWALFFPESSLGPPQAVLAGNRPSFSFPHFWRLVFSFYFLCLGIPLFGRFHLLTGPLFFFSVSPSPVRGASAYPCLSKASPFTVANSSPPPCVPFDSLRTFSRQFD